MKKQMNYILTGATAILVLLSSCKKEYDTPPVNEIPVGKKIQSINTLRNMYTGLPLKITEDYSVYGVVTIDENNGNMYKNVFIQDNPADVTNPDSIRGVNVRLMNSGGLYQGDYVRINLKNCVLSTYNGVKQIDSVDVDKNITKIATLVNIAPVEITMTEANANIEKYSGRLVKFTNVEFSYDEASIGKTYANAVTQATENRTLQDCSFNTLDVRTSGYANFANTKIPVGNGSITGVLSQFGSGLQLYLRTPNEAVMNGVRCDGTTIGTTYTVKNFDDGSITSGGWVQQKVSGTSISDWVIFGTSNPMAKISAYANSVYEVAENWLISPSINLSGSTNPVLGFKNDVRYTGDALKVYISTDGSSTASGNWTEITNLFTWDTDTGAYGIVDGGFTSLSTYKMANVHIAFKFTNASTSGSATWELDDIIVKEN